MLFISILFDVVVFGILIPALFMLFSERIDRILGLPRYNLIFLKVLGFLLICSGFILVVWSYTLIIRIGKGYTLEFFGKSFLPATKKLVTEGPYSQIRHPIALGYLGILLGIALTRNTLSGVLILFPLMVILSVLYLVFFEERFLDKRFKEEFKEYKRNAKFLIPSIKRKLR